MILNEKIVWLLIWLEIWTVWDIQHRVICLWQGVLVLVVGVLWQLFDGQLFVGSTVGGILVGLSAWGFSWLTKDQFGRGDALVVLCLGLYLGFSISLSILMWALLLASAVSVYLLLVKKKSSRQTLPFIPFLTAGYVIQLVLGSGGI